MLAGAAALAKAPFNKARAQQTRPAPIPPESPGFTLLNGRVLTQDPAFARAEAFAVKYGRFVAVGANSDVRNLGMHGGR